MHLAHYSLLKKIPFTEKCLLGSIDKDDKLKGYGGASSSIGSDELVSLKSNFVIKNVSNFYLAQGSSDSLSHPYPTAAVFVLLSKTFEAAAANGIRSVLSLYLRDSLMFSERHATVVLHSFNFFSQFLPIVGAIIADSYIGNAKTIFYFYLPYVIGYLLLLVGSFPEFYMIQ